MLTSIYKKEQIIFDKTESNYVNLNKLNWSEKNYSVLKQFIIDYGIDGKFYNSHKPPYAVLDWDNTSAYLDVEEAVMRYQIANFLFKMTKEQFRDLLKDEINGIACLSNKYNNLLLKNINQDLINDYNFLYDLYLINDVNPNPEDLKNIPQYLDFRSKLPYLYDGYCGTEGIEAEYGYPWVISLLSGFNIDEVRSLANKVITFELSNKLNKIEWISPAKFHIKSGVVSYAFISGLRILPEMQNLIAAFEAHGIDVFIISASYKPIVEVFSGNGTYGYNISPKRVIGMELEINNKGEIIPEIKADCFKTYGKGKVNAINSIIKQKSNRHWDPIFSSCDSDGDYEMCTMFPDMKLTLIWNRVKGGKIGKLYKSAVEETDCLNPRYILQGRNENTGIAIPCSETILFGNMEAQLLA